MNFKKDCQAVYPLFFMEQQYSALLYDVNGELKCKQPSVTRCIEFAEASWRAALRRSNPLHAILRHCEGEPSVIASRTAVKQSSALNYRTASFLAMTHKALDGFVVTLLAMTGNVDCFTLWARNDGGGGAFPASRLAVVKTINPILNSHIHL